MGLAFAYQICTLCWDYAYEWFSKSSGIRPCRNLAAKPLQWNHVWISVHVSESVGVGIRHGLPRASPRLQSFDSNPIRTQIYHKILVRPTPNGGQWRCSRAKNGRNASQELQPLSLPFPNPTGVSHGVALVLFFAVKAVSSINLLSGKSTGWQCLRLCVLAPPCFRRLPRALPEGWTIGFRCDSSRMD